MPKDIANATKSKRQKLDSSPVLTEEEKKVVMIQYEKENDPEDAEVLLTEYLKFMRIKIEGKATDKCAPPRRIDEMWHAHILSTNQYFAFCDRHNSGVYIHHDPSLENVPTRYELTLRRYAELFGYIPKDECIWPLPEEQSESEDGDHYDPSCG